MSVKMARGGAHSDVVLLPLNGEDLGGSLDSGSKVTALSKWSCDVALREHEMPMVQSFRRSQGLVNVVAGEKSVGKTRALWWPRRQVPKLCETVSMMPLL